MTIKTQTRNLESRLKVQENPTNGISGQPMVDFPGLTPTQKTTSFRTFSRFAVEEDPLSAEAIAEFTDVSGNGFKGETALSESQKDSYDNGHAFYTTKTFANASHPDFKHSWLNASGTGMHYYRGTLVPRNNTGVNNGFGAFPAERVLTSQEASIWGTKAIANVIPTQPGFSLSTFLGELTEGLPAILGLSTLKSRNDKVRSAGGEYLNIEFGWKPLISDLKKATHQLLNASRIIRQFERDGGRVVRRKFSFPTIVDDIPLSANIMGTAPGLVYFNTSSNMTAAFTISRGGRPARELYLEQLRTRSYSFSGAFQYAVIEGKTFSDKLEAFEQKANILLGTRVTPETLWNLAPWSWMADWGGTVGDVLTNATYLSSDGLVMRYGYLMAHTRDINRYIIPDGARFTTGVETGPISLALGRETKERVRATPYGFGLSISDFSPKQWAILAALGITRAPKTL